MGGAGIDAYIKENQTVFSDTDVSEFLTELCRDCPLSKSALARKSSMSEVYLHQVLSGRRRPSRDRLLCLCLGLEIGLEEVQMLLRQSGFAQLDPKVKRDAIISHGIIHGTELSVINDKLFEENEKTLF